MHESTLKFELLQNFMTYYFFTILCVEALSLIMCLYSTEVKSSDTTCLCVEAVDLVYIDVGFEDYKSIMVKSRKF
jgi:hypothetical protein